MDFCWAVDDLRWYLKTRKVWKIVQNTSKGLITIGSKSLEGGSWSSPAFLPQVVAPTLFYLSFYLLIISIRKEYHLFAEANNKVKGNHSPSIRLKGFESARILWRSSSSSSRQFSSSRSSMLWRPSQSSLMSSNSWGRQLLCESSNEEWKQHHWFVVKIWGCFNTMMTFTLSMTPLLPTVLCLAAPIEFWTANRRRLYKRQSHCL